MQGVGCTADLVPCTVNLTPLPIPCSLFPIPCSLFPVPYSPSLRRPVNFIELNLLQKNVIAPQTGHKQSGFALEHHAVADVHLNKFGWGFEQEPQQVEAFAFGVSFLGVEVGVQVEAFGQFADVAEAGMEDCAW